MAAPLGTSSVTSILENIEDITSLDLLRSKDEAVSHFFPGSSFSKAVLELFKKNFKESAVAEEPVLKETWASHPMHAQAAIATIFRKHILPDSPPIALKSVKLLGPRGHVIMRSHVVESRLIGAGHGRPVNR